MATPHRSLPQGMGPMLSPTQRSPPSSVMDIMGSWKGPVGEEMLYRWLDAKVEEDKRIAEQERTRQELTKLDQLRVEQQMLQEAARLGMSPNLIPVMFATASGVPVKGYGQDWARQQIGEILSQYPEFGGPERHHALMPAASQPELRRDKRSIAQAHRGSVEGPSPMSQHPPTSLIHTMAPPGAPQSGGPSQAREIPPFAVQQYQAPLSVNTSSRQPSQSSGHQGHSSSGPSGQRGSLPRINMSEMQLHQPPPFQVAPQQPNSQYPPPTSSAGESSSGSNFIFFHHYVPPGQQGSSGSGQRSSPPRSLDPPFAGQSNAAESSTSPRKRKSTSTQPQQPPPPTATTQPQAFSPIHSASTPGSRRAHSRQRSESTSAIRGPDHFGRHQHRSHRRSEVGYIPPDGPSHSDRDARASISGPPDSRPPTLPGINSHTFIQEHAPAQHRPHSMSAHQSHRSGSISQGEQSNQSLPPISVQTDPREPQPQYTSQRPMSAGPEMQRPHQYQPFPPREEPNHNRTRPGSRDEGPHNA
ncbi:hypothetical protein BJ508DRAFT_376669 [Ascobolus immersus RN42]|uniref:Uncharacterized protein n=1 Tax=Ascobolus immersus RN42 TaxID=1160509 RepID=A0A3N4I6P6_ASCIM|nr:hypothetical protein BJ508DRAFT_376669 [Ascobolus immersus RN42]